MEEPRFVLNERGQPRTSRHRRGQRQVTFVFDGGGSSPKLFLQILAAGFDLLTYRKARYPRIPRQAFRPRWTVMDGRTISYVLADQEVRLLQGRLCLRQDTRLMDNGHQAPILTSLRDPAAVRIAFHMFERWRQEKSFVQTPLARIPLLATADRSAGD